MDPYKIDFFALRVLSMVFELKSFSAAADALGVNQSVVSYAVNRMRDVFDDPLFSFSSNSKSSGSMCFMKPSSWL